MAEYIKTTKDNADFRALTKILDAELTERYGDVQAQYDKFNGADSLEAVVLAMDGTNAVGCGGYKIYEEGVAEVKRMFVLSKYRGQGISRRLMEVLEAEIAEAGFKKILIETGPKQHEAIGLYESHGYIRIENYGQYRDMPASVCYEKKLI